MILYEYVDTRGGGVMTFWVATKEVREHAGYLDQALDRLEQTSNPDKLPGIFVGPVAPSRHVYKLRLGGKVRLRPMLCLGPVDNPKELTFLIGAFERNWKLDPPDAVQRADERRDEIIADPKKRRRRWR